MNGQNPQQQQFRIVGSGGVPIRFAPSQLNSGPLSQFQLVSSTDGSFRRIVNPGALGNFRLVSAPTKLKVNTISPQQNQQQFVLMNQQGQQVQMQPQQQQPQRVIVNSSGNPVIMKRPIVKKKIISQQQAPQKRTQPPPLVELESIRQHQQQQISRRTSSPALKVKNTPPTSGNSTPNRSPKRKGTLMRLRCRSRQLLFHSAFFDNNEILEKDADVLFMCGDGGCVRGHKLILAAQSTFFTDVLRDQPIGEITTISVPDISSEIMKLILLLAYKSSVMISSDQMEQVKEYFGLFGLNFGNMSTEVPNEETPLDVHPGKLIENISRKMKVGGDNSMNNNNAHYIGGGGGIGRRKMMPSFTSEQLENLQMNKKSIPSTMDDDADDDDTSNSNIVIVNNKKKYSTYSDEDEPFKIQGYPNTQHFERRKAKLTPRIETETQSPTEAELKNFPESDESMLKQWMDNVGKSDSQQQRARTIVEKRKRHECKTCAATFFKEAAWKWHEDRHFNHGIYKCTMCDALKTTARAIWLHEESCHNVVDLPLEDIEESNVSPNKNATLSSQPSLQTNLAIHMAQIKRMRAAKLASTRPQQQLIRNSSEPLKTYKASPQQQQATGIKVGQHSVEASAEMRNNKQLHWLYVCARCDNCSDSAGNAQVHFKKCYPNGEALFESTVTKYRQGFYGRSRCPICPRRYVANGGWVIHVTHQHEAYRTLFLHTGNVEDKLKCTHCNRQFSYPDEFHAHLFKGQECRQTPIKNEETLPQQLNIVKTPNSSEGSGKTTTPTNNSKPEPKPIAVKSKPVPIPPTPTPPRSARLQKRASAINQAILLAKVLKDQIESDEDNKESKRSSSKSPKRRRASSTASSVSATVQQDYSPIECPICGTEITNISQHFSTEHKDMNISVDRISTDLLKCRHCRMTFGTDDLFSHGKMCKHERITDGEDTKSEMSDSTEVLTNKSNKKPAPEPIEIPPNVGVSSITEMGYTIEELLTKDVVLQSLICPVCQKRGTRMGEISICLKQHGIRRCSLCFNTYSKIEDFDMHMKSCHYGPSNRLKCPFCTGRSFINVGQSIGHLINFHWGEFFLTSKANKVIPTASVPMKKPEEEHAEAASDTTTIEVDDDEIDGSTNKQQNESEKNMNGSISNKTEEEELLKQDDDEGQEIQSDEKTATEVEPMDEQKDEAEATTIYDVLDDDEVEDGEPSNSESVVDDDLKMDDTTESM